MAVPIRAQTFRSHRQRGLWLKRSLWLFGGSAVVGGMIWIFLFSPVFAIADVRVNGAEVNGDDAVAQTVRDLLAQKKLYVFQPMRNILLLSAGAVSDHIKEQYASIGGVVVTKEYPHSLAIAVTERKPAGQWCRGQEGDECQLFDRQGAHWGRILPSTGPLLLLIKDERETDDRDPKLLEGILASLDGLPKLGLAARTVILPDAEPGGMTIKTTRGYDILMDANDDVADQLSVLGIFLSDRAKDPAFLPQYIDLRTPGRVYYK